MIGSASAVIVVVVIVVIIALRIHSRCGLEHSSSVCDRDSGDSIGDDVPETHVRTETYLGPGTYVGTAIDGLAGDVTVESVDNTGVFAFDTLGDRRRF
jgi:hypothetical protein